MTIDTLRHGPGQTEYQVVPSVPPEISYSNADSLGLREELILLTNGDAYVEILEEIES